MGMKKLFPIFLCVYLLVGCNGNDGMNEALALRSAIVRAKSCHFTTNITADYGDMIYNFTMACVADENGNLSFTVVEPKTIAGITGRLTADGGSLTFDESVLAIPMLTDDQITPVSAPWILMRTLRGGYISSCAKGRITIDDSYAEDALTLDILLDENNHPVFAEIYWKNRRILTLEVSSFVLA